MSSGTPGPRFAPRTGTAAVEHGRAFAPLFDAQGLIPAIVTDADSGQVLMVAWMNAETLALTLDTGIAHFWSRSRSRVWKKGEESGNFLNVVRVLTDCDQDVVQVEARVAGDGVACHTGARSCFYREVLPSPAPGAGPYGLKDA
jgi:phosphoribosyl-AMP cyclohydrolase